MLKFWLSLMFMTFATQDLVRLQSFEEDQRISVLTKYGEVVGKYEKVSILTENMTTDYAFVQKFQGIPFAEPPIGELRFKPPLEPKPWTGKILALKPYKYCAQELSIHENISISDMSEDCLYLTIWVPTPARRNLAVMVYTYGSAFKHGPSLHFDFARFVALENVIVVMMNYRLSAMGFMDFGHEDCPGNMGLMDQEMAFKWTRDNIERFGGQPERITIIGHSSGSISTNFQLLNPSARYLFKRVALFSGFLNIGRVKNSKKGNFENSLKVARIVGCGNEANDTKRIVECLRAVDSRALNEASTSLHDPVLQMTHYPVLDEKISLENLKRLQRAGNKEVLLGLLTNDDGNHIINVLNEKLVCPKDLFKYIANQYLGNVSEETLRSIRYYYKDHCDAIREFEEEILTTRLVTDLAYLCPAQELADKLATAGIKTYFYQWTHRPLLSENPVWIDATHTDELRYTFAWYDQLEGTAEIKLSRRFMAYLGSFVKYGDPNGENNLWNDSETLQRWPVYTLEEKGRLEIDLLNSTRAFGAIQEDQCRFWKHDLTLIYKGMTS